MQQITGAIQDKLEHGQLRAPVPFVPEGGTLRFAIPYGETAGQAAGGRSLQSMIQRAVQDLGPTLRQHPEVTRLEFTYQDRRTRRRIELIFERGPGEGGAPGSFRLAERVTQPRPEP